MCHFLAPAGQPEMMRAKLHARAFRFFRGAVYFVRMKFYEQKRCFPIWTIRGLDQIQALVAVSGLK